MPGARPDVESRLARDNPFRSGRVEQLGFRLSSGGAEEQTWAQLLDRFADLGWRAALVGPKGRGKTTLLEALEERMTVEGWTVRRLRLSEEQPTCDAATLARLCEPGSTREKILVSIDGAEQLSRWSWWRLRRTSRQVQGLLVTSHLPCGLPMLRHHQTDPVLLRELLEDLLGCHGARLVETRSTEYFEEFAGDVRQTFRALYDDWSAGRIPRVTEGQIRKVR